MCRCHWLLVVAVALVAAGPHAQVAGDLALAAPSAVEEDDSDPDIEPADLPGSPGDQERSAARATLDAPLPRNAISPDVRDAAASAGSQELTGTPRRFRYRVSVEVRGVSDDNITLSHHDPKHDVYGQLEAELTLGFGDVLQADENYILLN